MKNPVTIQQAMQYVADNPRMATDEVTQIAVHELVVRELFDIANRPDASVRGSLNRANKARKMILDRLVGRREAGTSPAAKQETTLSFVDLTGKGELG